MLHLGVNDLLGFFQVRLWLYLPAFRGVPYRLPRRSWFLPRCERIDVPPGFPRWCCGSVNSKCNLNPNQRFGILRFIQYLAYYNPQYERLIEEYKPEPVPPEARLGIAIIGAPLFAVGFFWFGWTSYPSISYWAPLLSGTVMGFSVVFIFVSTSSYII